jgi:hypothetical protein
MNTKQLDAFGEPVISSKNLINQINKLGPEKLKSILGEEGANSVQKFARSVHVLVSAPGRRPTSDASNKLIMRLREAAGDMMRIVPGVGRLLLASMRAVSRADLDLSVEQKARRAINTQLLKNENVLSDILSQRVSVGGAAAIGQQTGPEGAQEQQEFLNLIHTGERSPNADTPQ